MRRVFLMMAACCVLASPALAGGGVDLYLGYGDVVDGDWELGLGARLSLGGTHWMFDVAATGYQTVEGVTILDATAADEIDVKYRAFDLGVRYLFYDGHKVRPYVGAGLSYAQVSAVNMRIDSGLGLYGLAGLRVGKTDGDQLHGRADLSLGRSSGQLLASATRETSLSAGSGSRSDSRSSFAEPRDRTTRGVLGADPPRVRGASRRSRRPPPRNKPAPRSTLRRPISPTGFASSKACL